MKTFQERSAGPVALLLLACALAFAPQAYASQKSECFNLDGLSPELQRKSEQYLLQALDTEHLFTIVSGLKPMSAGFHAARVSTAIPTMTGEEAGAVVAALADRPEADLTGEDAMRLSAARHATSRAAALREIDELRRIVARWRCGDELHADVVHSATSHAGERHVQGVVFALPSLERLIGEKHRFFSRWAITPGSSPLEVLMAVEHARDTSRFAGYGYLFGYPDAAVRFFADASIHQDMTGDFVVRDFRAIPTFQRDTGQFTYAVPRGAEDSDADRALKVRAAAILDAYRARRAAYVGEGRPGVAAMLRDWFCPTEDRCSPANAPL